MVYGYARVSTPGQARYGYGLKIQEQDLLNAGCDKVYKEVASGASKNRPVLRELLDKLKSGDTLVVTRIDRLSRSYEEGTELINLLREKDVSLRSLDFGEVRNTAAGKLIASMFFAFSELEHDFIQSKMEEGLEDAKDNNPSLKLGRKRVDIDEDKFKKLIEKTKSGEMTVSECCNELGISRTTWYSRLKEIA